MAVNACGRMPAWPFESGGTMSDGPDLVSLLYRADWTRLSLTAEVSTTRDLDLWRSRFDNAPPRAPDGGQFGPWSAPWFAPWIGPPRGLADEDPGVPWKSWQSRESRESWQSPEEGEPGRRFGGPSEPRPDGHEWELATEVLGTETSRFTLLIAPGRRYREQGEGYLRGCDGDRSWFAGLDDDGWSVEAADGPEPPPTARLLRPSWLLTGFTLEPAGPASVSGRDALRVVATPREGAGNWPVVSRRPLDQVEAVVDAELGILLRCEEILHGKPLRVTELADVRVDPAPAGDDAPFLPPGGWDSVDESGPPGMPGAPWRTMPNGPGWEVTKLAAGLAAGGLGALIKRSTFRPFETATQEEAEAEMPPSDEPLSTDAPPAGDEVLHLLHSSPDRWSPGISATLHQWHDIAAMLARIPDSARRAGFGGLGLLIDTAGERIATEHTIFRLRLGGPGQYRIEPVVFAGRPGGSRLKTIVCDGERRWRIGEDEVTTGPASALPREIGSLFDASWLLEHQLTGGGEFVAGGRRGYRVGVAYGWPWGGWFFPGDVVVDAELGILLRCISFSGSRSGSQPVMRYELRDVAIEPSVPGDFQPDIPAGMRVVDEPGYPPEPVNPAGLIARQAVKEARSAVNSFLGVIRGENTR
jgi:hypothetical protein